MYRDQLISQFGTSKEELVQFFGKICILQQIFTCVDMYDFVYMHISR
jgi:hypothetical protein